MKGLEIEAIREEVAKGNMYAEFHAIIIAFQSNILKSPNHDGLIFGGSLLCLLFLLSSNCFVFIKWVLNFENPPPLSYLYR